MKFSLLQIKKTNGVSDILNESVCGNCIHYDWILGDRHKGDCLKRIEEGKRTPHFDMTFLPAGLHSLTNAKECEYFELETNNEKIIDIFNSNF